MATILIIDDRAANREFLVTLLGYGGHRLLEASDGAEGLSAARSERPHLVIADILMPTMDGYEFVRRLRAEPDIADTRVLFCTAHYHEVEARKLADACGVTAVLTKPCEPELVLKTVEAALGNHPPPVALPEPDVFDREHLHLLTDKLSQKADELRRTNERLTAMVELGLKLGSERHPSRMLQLFCDASREILGAKYTIVGIPNGIDPPYRYLFTSGIDGAAVAQVARSNSLSGVLGTLLRAGRCFRTANHPGLEAVGLPASFPVGSALLAAPVLSPARVYGWICLLDKLGADAFSEADEQIAKMLAAQVGRMYENGSLYADLLQHASRLAEEVSERKRSEQALRASEERFRGAFEHTGVAMALTDPDNRFVRVNTAFARLFGFSTEEMLGMTVAQVTHPDDLAESLARRDALLAEGGNFFQTENRFVHRNGHAFWSLTNVSLVRDETGRPLLYVGQIQDITERKHAEAEVRRTTELLRAVTEGTTDAVFVKDRESKYLLLNGAAARFAGKSVEEILGRDDTALFDAAGARLAMERDRRVMATGRVETEEETLTAAGVTRTFLAMKGPYRDNSGEVAGVIGISRDITDRKQAEADLRLRDRAIRAVPQGLIITDSSLPDEPIIYANPGFEYLTGYGAAEVYGRNCRFLQGKDTSPEAVAQLREAVRGGSPCSVEFLNYRKDGSAFWNQLTITPVRDNGGRLTHFVGVQNDVTARRNLEAQFRQSQKMEAVGQLAGGIAHDFNNLLTVINGFAELVLGTLPEGNPDRRYVQEIVNAGERASALTRQLLAFSRKDFPEPKLLNINAVIQDVERMLRRIIGEDIQLTVVPNLHIGSVRADAGHIEQVILNLVVNARDAMPQGGKITIEVRDTELDAHYVSAHPSARPESYVMLAVSDTGSGMSPETVARIFEPFFTTKGEHGTGLGLATVQGIVSQVGGHIGVYSELGHGTTFKVYLPRAETGPIAPSRRLAALRMPKGKETVVLVEDEDGVRSLALLVLRKCGYRVLEARDGDEALALAAEHGGAIDLLLTDVVMPRMSGREVAERFHGRYPHLKVLFLSGYTDDAVVRHGILRVDVDFLQKPFTPGALAAKVREVLDRK